MELAPFVTKQIRWACKHLPDNVDQARADWWLAEIAELERREAEAFPAEPASPAIEQPNPAEPAHAVA